MVTIYKTLQDLLTNDTATITLTQLTATEILESIKMTVNTVSKRKKVINNSKDNKMMQLKTGSRGKILKIRKETVLSA